MRIKIVYGNHTSFGIHVADTLLLIQKLFELAGLRADFEQKFSSGNLNVVLEGFNDKFTLEAERAMQVKGSRLIIVATEFLTGTTFNDFNAESDNSHYSKGEYWSHRFNNFLKLEKYSEAVWHLSESEVSPFRRLLGHDRVFYLPHFWVPGLSRVEHLSDREKDIDFLFTGTETNYRLAILDILKQKGYRVEHALTAAFHREDLLARTKISLNIRQNAEWQYPSPSRFFYHLINSSLLITEKCSSEADIQEHVLTAPEGKLIEFCDEQLAAGEYTKRGAEFMEAFKAKHQMRNISSWLIEASLSRRDID